MIYVAFAGGWKEQGNSFDENAPDYYEHAEPLEPLDSLPEDGDGEDGAPQHGGHPQHLEQSSVLQEGQSHVAQGGSKNVHEGGLFKIKE